MSVDVDNDPINRPKHYTYGSIEPILVIEDWNLGYHLSCVIKYLARCNHKGNKLEDLKKARWYLDREISRIEASVGIRC